MNLAEKFREYLGYPEKEEYDQEDRVEELQEEAQESAAAVAQISILCPRAFEDASVVVDHLNQGRTIVLNLESISGEAVRRLMDFLGGAAYAKDARIDRIAQNAYVITPYYVEFFSDAEDDGFSL